MSGRTAIDAFLRQGQRSHRVADTLLSLASHALPAGLILLIVEWARPGLSVPATVAVACWLGTVGVYRWWSTRLPISATDSALGLRDGLRTWVDGNDSAANVPMRDWLGDVLGRRLATVSSQAVQRAWRRPLGTVRYLLPILIVLLLLRWLAPPFPPNTAAPNGPPTESAQGGADSSSGSGDSGDGDGGSEADGATDPTGTLEQPDPAETDTGPTNPDQPTPQPDLQPDGPDPEDQPPPPNGESDPKGEDAGSELPPKPIPELPVGDEFVVPDFIGDGPTRTEMARQAAISEGPQPPNSGGGAAQAPPPSSDVRGGAAGGPGDPPTEPDPPGEYRRAHEQALRSPYLRPSERAFVQRYFDAVSKAWRAKAKAASGAPGPRRSSRGDK